ncbi:MAG: rod-binding protein [Chthoniobacter sp.]|nr:rod-binding protein [Chthoniobacter sp.]
MQIPPITAVKIAPERLGSELSVPHDPDLGNVSHQFESILIRQFLTESMKSLLDGGPSGQVYGYMLTDSLANSISEAGGLGMSSVIQAQLEKPTR